MKTENISNCYHMESDQVYEGLKLDKGTFEVDIEGKYICIYDEEGFYSIERLEEAEKFTMKAISTTKPAYNFVTNKLGCIKVIELELGNKIRKLKAIDPFIREDYHLGEYVTAFANAWEKTGMDYMVNCNPTALIRGKMAGEHINDFLSELRKNANDKDLKIKILIQFYGFK